MDYEKDEKKTSFQDLLIGIAIGVFLGVAIVKLSERSTTQTMNTQTVDIATQLRQLNQSLEEIKLRLDIPSFSPQTHDEQLPPNMKPVMENEENFELKLNEKGRMIGFTNHRRLYQKDEEK